jgi:hypothetical protein
MRGMLRAVGLNELLGAALSLYLSQLWNLQNKWTI